MSSILVGLEDAGLRAQIGRLAEAGRGRAMLARIGEGLTGTTKQRFMDGTAPDGSAWAPLNPEYAKFKKGPGILRGPRAAAAGLMASIHWRIEGLAVRVGTNKRYGRIHQFGGVIVPVRAKALVFRIGNRVIHAKRVTIPARPYLGLGAADRLAVQEAIEFTWREAIGA